MMTQSMQKKSVDSGYADSTRGIDKVQQFTQSITSSSTISCVSAPAANAALHHSSSSALPVILASSSSVSSSLAPPSPSPPSSAPLVLRLSSAYDDFFSSWKYPSTDYTVS